MPTRKPVPFPSDNPIVDAAPGETNVVKSAARVLRIFEFFDDVQRPARLSEVSTRLDLPASSASVLLHSLVRLGYLYHDAVTHSFMPTSRVAMLGSWTGDDLDRDGRLEQMLQELSTGTGETITIATRNGIFAQYIRVVQATTALRIHVPTGTRRLLVWSAAGIALLADAEESEIAALVHRTNSEDLNSGSHIDLRRVLENVGLFREQGYFFSRGLVTTAGGHIAMRLPSADIAGRQQVYALGVAGWIERIERNETKIVQQMKAALERRAGQPRPGERV